MELEVIEVTTKGAGNKDFKPAKSWINFGRMVEGKFHSSFGFVFDKFLEMQNTRDVLIKSFQKKLESMKDGESAVILEGNFAVQLVKVGTSEIKDEDLIAL